MGPLAQFLLALTNLVRSGIIRKLPDAIKAAEREFGKVTPLLKKQIERIFEQAKKPKVGEPGKKEGAVIPFVKKTEGIETLDDKGLTDSPLDDLKRIIEDSGGTAKTRDEVLRDEMLKDTEKPSDVKRKDFELMEFFQKGKSEEPSGKFEGLESTDNIRMGIENLKNPRRPGGPLDPVTGVARTIARRILDRKGIKIDRREDPLDVFIDKFGIEVATDVGALADDIVDAEQIGRKLKPLDDLIEIQNLFDVEVDPDANPGITNEEMIERLEKDLKEKETLEDFDPTDREPNAKGGLTRTSYAMGKGPVLPSDEDPINPFGPKPTGPVLPDKSMMANLGDQFLSPEYEDEFRKFLMMLEESEKEQSLDRIMEMFKQYMLSKEPKAMEAATGGLAGIINL